MKPQTRPQKQKVKCKRCAADCMFAGGQHGIGCRLCELKPRAAK